MQVFVVVVVVIAVFETGSLYIALAVLKLKSSEFYEFM